ncbi:uncharacterized protein [Triticum aestivum]|uniref:uncharacterized protein n=1 Tax=Triticum aestivum TaxID=4565 RepID=UPI001D019341|nr:uncharacterized protein LOC123152337 [Triticum aestivum]
MAVGGTKTSTPPSSSSGSSSSAGASWTGAGTPVAARARGRPGLACFGLARPGLACSGHGPASPAPTTASLPPCPAAASISRRTTPTAPTTCSPATLLGAGVGPSRGCCCACTRRRRAAREGPDRGEQTVERVQLGVAGKQVVGGGLEREECPASTVRAASRSARSTFRKPSSRSPSSGHALPRSCSATAVRAPPRSGCVW